LFFIFADKLGYFTINYFFPFCSKHASLPSKTENFFVSEEKSFIGSATGANFTNILKADFSFKSVFVAFLYL